jgi:MinD-like ATPase involved in chromosome partitioning or flagellar assembly
VVKADFTSRSESYDRAGSSASLFEALALNEPIMNFCTATQDDNLWVLDGGGPAGGPPGLLTAEGMKARISELRDTFDFVVIAGPPLDRFAEGLIFSQLSDGVILVLESGATRREDSETIVANLRSSNIPILAAVLNNYAEAIPQKLRRFI